MGPAHGDHGAANDLILLAGGGVQLAVWSSMGSGMAVVIDYKVYYASTPHREAMVKLTDQNERREGVADLLYESEE